MKFNSILFIILWFLLSAFTGFPQPSYHQGYARNVGESVYPSSWISLVAAWIPVMGPSGGTVFDLSPYKKDCTLTNMDPATDWVITNNPRLPGYALAFDGTAGNDHLDCGDHTIHDLTDGKNTIIAWIKLTTFGESNQGRIIDKGGANVSNSWSFMLVTDHLEWWTNDGGNAASATSSVPTGEWIHVAMVQSKNGEGIDSTVSFFVNGVDVSSDTTADIPLGGNTQTIGIGARTNDDNREFDGEIASVFIWTKTFTPREVMDDYRISLASLVLIPRFVAKAPAVAPGVVPFRTLMGTGTKIIERRAYPCGDTFCY